MSAVSVGRPRSAEADAAIADAALALLAEVGFDGVTVEAVAARAGVAKSTVYRRHPGKLELLTSVLTSATAAMPADPDTGSVNADLVVLVDQIRRIFATTAFGEALPAVIAAAARHHDVAEVARSFIDARRQVTAAAIRRGVDRGELRADTDVDLLIDAVVGPLFYRLFVLRRPVTAERVRLLVDHALAAVSQHPASRPAPAAAPPVAGRRGRSAPSPHGTD